MLSWFSFGKKEDQQKKIKNNNFNIFSKEKLLDEEIGIIYSNDLSFSQYLNIKFNYTVKDYYDLIKQNNDIIFNFLIDDTVLNLSQLANKIYNFGDVIPSSYNYIIENDCEKILVNYEVQSKIYNLTFDFTNNILIYNVNELNKEEPFDLVSIQVNNKQSYFSKKFDNLATDYFMITTTSNYLYNTFKTNEFFQNKIILLDNTDNKYTCCSEEEAYFENINSQLYYIKGKKILLSPEPSYYVDYIQNDKITYTIFEGDYFINDKSYKVYYNNNNKNSYWCSLIKKHDIIENYIIKNLNYHGYLILEKEFKYDTLNSNLRDLIKDYIIFYNDFMSHLSNLYYVLNYGVYFNILYTDTIVKIQLDNNNNIMINGIVYKYNNIPFKFDNNMNITYGTNQIIPSIYSTAYDHNNIVALEYKGDDHCEFFNSFQGNEKYFLPIGCYLSNTIVTNPFKNYIKSYFDNKFPEYISPYYKSILIKEFPLQNITSIIKNPQNIKDFYDIINFIFTTKGKILLCYNNGNYSQMSYLFISYSEKPYIFDIVLYKYDNTYNIYYGINELKTLIFDSMNSSNSNTYILAWEDKKTINNYSPLLTFTFDNHSTAYKFKKDVKVQDIKQYLTEDEYHWPEID